MQILGFVTNNDRAIAPENDLEGIGMEGVSNSTRFHIGNRAGRNKINGHVSEVFFFFNFGPRTQQQYARESG